MLAVLALALTLLQAPACHKQSARSDVLLRQCSPHSLVIEQHGLHAHATGHNLHHTAEGRAQGLHPAIKHKLLPPRRCMWWPAVRMLAVGHAELCGGTRG
jgi:hypothetical protein